MEYTVVIQENLIAINTTKVLAVYEKKVSLPFLPFHGLKFSVGSEDYTINEIKWVKDNIFMLTVKRESYEFSLLKEVDRLVEDGWKKIKPSKE